MSNLSLGKIITTGPAQRDAIYITIAPVVAGEPLEPGEHIGFSVGDVTGETITPSNSVWSVVNGGRLIGVVDPFLTRRVNKGETFWMFLYPDTSAGVSFRAPADEFAHRNPTAAGRNCGLQRAWHAAIGREVRK